MVRAERIFEIWPAPIGSRIGASGRAGRSPHPPVVSLSGRIRLTPQSILYIYIYILDMRETMIANPSETRTTIDEIVDNFSLLEEWDDRYRYVIELGRGLSALPERDRSEANKVQGCASQVWLATTVRPDGRGGPVLTFSGDSDAHIVRGLIAILFAIFSGKRAADILSTDAIALFERLGLREHLTPQRSNGFRSMVDRIRADARAALATAA
jgi:cysteine desulfuration protein SufE